MSDANVVDPMVHTTKKVKLGRKLMDDDYEILISEVQSRPPLWNDRHNDFKNTAITRKLWNEVGAAINLSGEETKPKWKNLKDKFRKILQKPPPKSGSAATTPPPKWKFYELMLFCKDVVLPSPMIGNLMPSTVEDGFPESDTSNTQVQDEDNTTLFDDGASSIRRVEQNPQQPQRTQLLSQSNSRFARPHRSKSAGIRKNEFEIKLMKLEEKKIDAILQMQNKNDQGEDYHFFMSLIPYMKVFDPLEKLQVRSNIQAAVMEAYRNYEARHTQPYYSRPPSSFSVCTSTASNYSGQLTPVNADGQIDDVNNVCDVGNAILQFNLT